MFVLCVDNKQREENESWFNQFIWRGVGASETAGSELTIKGLVFARRQIAFMNQEDDNEIPSPLQGSGTIYCTFIYKPPRIFDLE